MIGLINSFIFFMGEKRTKSYEARSAEVSEISPHHLHKNIALNDLIISKQLINH